MSPTARRRRSPLALASLTLAAVVAVPGDAAADEIRLSDGRTLIGKATIRNDVVKIVTRTGETVRVKKQELVRIRTDADLIAELERLSGSPVARSPLGQLELARMAYGWGLVDEMWSHLDTAVTTAEAPFPGRLSSWLRTLEPELLPKRFRNRSDEMKARELVQRVRRGQSPAKLAAIEEVLGTLPEADEQLRRSARHASQPMQRLAALRALTKRRTFKDKGRWFLFRTALLDGNQDVRRESMELTSELGRSTDALSYLAKGLIHDHPLVRMRTAEAFANLKDLRAVDLLVHAGPLVKTVGLPGGSHRAHAAFMSQASYIRDFNVEIAQAAFIADPVVDVLQSGAVLDVTVHAVTTVRHQVVDAYRGAIKHLTGSDPGSRVASWSDWRSNLNLPGLGTGIAAAAPGAAGVGGPVGPGPAGIPAAIPGGVPVGAGPRGAGCPTVGTPDVLIDPRRVGTIPKGRSAGVPTARSGPAPRGTKSAPIPGSPRVVGTGAGLTSRPGTTATPSGGVVPSRPAASGGGTPIGGSIGGFGGGRR